MPWCYSGALLAYFRRGFHPDQDSHSAPEQRSQALAQRWLRENAGSFRVVR